MFIQTEQTPNPDSLKFLPGCAVLEGSGVDFRSAKEAHFSPLAQRLFHLKGVESVFLGPDFVTVGKAHDMEWTTLKIMILGALMEHFSTGQKVMDDQGAVPSSSANDDGVTKRIKEILDTRIRPVLAADGGGVTFHAFKDGIVYLQLRGACAGCPSAAMTLKSGVERLLKQNIPEVSEVRAVG